MSGIAAAIALVLYKAKRMMLRSSFILKTNGLQREIGGLRWSLVRFWLCKRVLAVDNFYRCRLCLDICFQSSKRSHMMKAMESIMFRRILRFVSLTPFPHRTSTGVTKKATTAANGKGLLIDLSLVCEASPKPGDRSTVRAFSI